MSATLIREFAARDAGRLAAVLAELQGLPEQLAERRKRLFREVAVGRKGADLHAGRDDYRRLYDDYIESTERYRGLAAAAGLGDAAAEFGRIADQVRQQRDDLFGRWQTLEDLHQVIIEQFALTPDQVAAYAGRHPPPQWWFDEDVDPFTPA